jgi:hypothetical protein
MSELAGAENSRTPSGAFGTVMSADRMPIDLTKFATRDIVTSLPRLIQQVHCDLLSIDCLNRVQSALHLSTANPSTDRELDVQVERHYSTGLALRWSSVSD